jgi:glycosyltransferase involved in cell wall biosynthesis
MVMPNYNHGAFVGSALRALLAQTRPADEIIVIDDASTDDSLATIEALAAGRPDVSIVRNRTRGGPLNALNAGLEIASGDLIAFPAADDLVAPDFLEESAALLRAFPAAPFCSACVALIGSQGEHLGVRPVLRPILERGYATAKSARSILERGDNFFLGPVTVYRRDRLLELGGFDRTLGASSDGMLQRRMAVRWGFCFIPRILGAWRLHGSNFSAAAVESPEKLDRLIDVNRDVIGAEPPGLFPANYAELFERRLRFNAARLALLRKASRGGDDDGLGDLCSMIRATPMDRRILGTLQGGTPVFTFLSLGWLAMRLRPFSFSWLGMEALRRAIAERPRIP